MKRDATALRAITHADEEIAKGDVLLGMDAGQFGDWSMAGIVRAATQSEIARVKGGKAPAAKKRASRKRSAAKPAPAATAPIPSEPAASEAAKPE